MKCNVFVIIIYDIDILFIQVVSDFILNKFGVYWSWNNQLNLFENEFFQEVSDVEKVKKLWEISEKFVNLL